MQTSYGENVREIYRTSHGKFDSPMAVVLDDLYGNGDPGDDAEYNADWGESWIRYGRRILETTGQGFISCETFPTVADAERAMDKIHAIFDEEGE